MGKKTARGMYKRNGEIISAINNSASQTRCGLALAEWAQRFSRSFFPKGVSMENVPANSPSDKQYPSNVHIVTKEVLDNPPAWYDENVPDHWYPTACGEPCRIIRQLNSHLSDGTFCIENLAIVERGPLTGHLVYDYYVLEYLSRR